MTTTLCGSQKISYYTNSNEWGEVQRNTKNNEYLSTKISNSQTLELRYKCLHWMISGVYTWGQNLSSNCGYHYLEHYGGWKQYTLNLPICKIWSQQTSKSNMEYTSHMSNKDCTLKTYVHNGKKMPKSINFINENQKMSTCHQDLNRLYRPKIWAVIW